MTRSQKSGDLFRSQPVMQNIRRYANKLTRKKSAGTDNMNTNLRRCLSTTDITLLAIGHMVGSGVYVLTATVAKNVAGPAIVVSFILSGFASFLAALCYAELGVRFPRSGSAYSYTYLSLGEFWAFLVGWNVILEHIIAAAAACRACSSYIDSLANGLIKNGTEQLIGRIEMPLFAEQLDFLALGIIILFVTFLSFGVKITSSLNNILSVVNLTVISIIICVGAYFSDTSNWTSEETGGFMPFGWSGVLAASASCFYAYVGFDSIAASGEEVKDPQRSIPKATIISMAVASIAYVSVSSVLTLMVNYQDIVNDSGLPEALAYHGAMWAKICVILGALCGMSTSIIGSLFALTRLVYAMADDGLLFPLCSNVHAKTKIPLGAMYIFSSISGFMTLTLDINSLVEMMSIGTLFAYLVVSASVIILRYTPIENAQKILTEGNDKSKTIVEDCGGKPKRSFQFLQACINSKPGKLVKILLVCFVILFFIAGGFVIACFSKISDGSWWAITIFCVLVIGLFSILILVAGHEQSIAPVAYKVSFVPWIPAMSVAINTVLILNLQVATWIRLLVWVFVGLFIYFFYGVKHSILQKEIDDD